MPLRAPRGVSTALVFLISSHLKPLKTPRCYRLRRQQKCLRLLHATSRVAILYFLPAHTPVSCSAATVSVRVSRLVDTFQSLLKYIPKSSKALRLPECRCHGHVRLSRGPQSSRAFTTQEPNPCCVHVRRLQTSPLPPRTRLKVKPRQKMLAVAQGALYLLHMLVRLRMRMSIERMRWLRGPCQTESLEMPDLMTMTTRCSQLNRSVCCKARSALLSLSGIFGLS